MIEKSVTAIKESVGGVSSHVMESLPGIIHSMGTDEEIIYVFKCSIVEKNPKRSNKESVTSAVNILTNKKFYFAGTDGQSMIFLTMPKSGSVNLKDVHATNQGRTLQGEYIGFETKNEDYKIWLYAGDDSTPIKSAFDKAIEGAQTEEKEVTIQTPISSADELKKFKELLDMGAITQEEYDKKKKQILGF